MSRQNPAKNRPAWRRLHAGLAVLLLPIAIASAGEEGQPEGPESQPAPGQDVRAPGQDAPTPGQDARAPGEAVRAPGEAVRAPGEDVRAPGEAVRTRTDGTPALTPPPAVASAVAAPPGQTDNLHSLEQRVGDLKEQIFRAKARLSLLGERFLRSTVGGGRAVVTQKTQMGRLYQPLRITYQLDGRELWSKGDDKTPLALSAAQLAELAVWDGGLKPGDHTLAVSVVYRGNATPAFSYFNQYTYTASAAQRFHASDGGTTRIRVVCREKGNPVLNDVAERPLIEFTIDDGNSQPGSSGAPVAAKAAPLGNP